MSVGYSIGVLGMLGMLGIFEALLYRMKLHCRDSGSYKILRLLDYVFKTSCPTKTANDSR